MARRRSSSGALYAALGVAGGLGALALVSRKSAAALPSGLAYGALVSPDFRERVIAIGKELNINPSYLMAMMFHESGLNSKIYIVPAGEDKNGNTIYKRYTDPTLPEVNKALSGGLIGFTAKTARGLGTTLPNLLNMSPVGQLEYVKEFYAVHMANGTLPSNPSMRALLMSTFWPIATKYADIPDYVLFEKGSKAYKHNPSTDRNKDGKVTVNEAVSRIDGVLANGFKPGKVF